MRRTAPLLLLLASLALADTAWTQEDPAPEPEPPAPEWTSAFANMPDGGKIRVLEAIPGPDAAKDRPSILFVPGWTIAAEIWEPQLRHFAQTHRAVAMDPRSQGMSSKTGEGSSPLARAHDLAAVIDSLRLSPTLLVCWSLAVDECAAYVGQYGTARIRGLVFVDGAVASPVAPEALGKFVQSLAGWQTDRRAKTEQFVRGLYKTPQSEEYLKKVIEGSLRTPTDTAIALTLGYRLEDRRPVLAKIDKPTLVVVAESPFVEQYREMQKKIPSSRMEVFAGAGHALFVDQADRFNRLIEDFDKGLKR